MKPEPAHDRVMVRPELAEAMTTGRFLDPDIKKKGKALHIPEDAREIPNRGEVLGVGPSVSSCRVGDHVHYGKYTGDEIPIDGEDLLFIRDLDVIAVEKGETWAIDNEVVKS